MIKLFREIYILFLVIHGFNAFAQNEKKMFASTISYDKWGPQHGFLITYQTNSKFIISYEFGVNINTSYIQGRFRPINQLTFGYKFSGKNDFFSLAPLIGITADSYAFSKDERLNKMAFQGGYVIELGKGRWKFIQRSFVGYGNEFHWQNKINPYFDYKIGIGVQYDF